MKVVVKIVLSWSRKNTYVCWYIHPNKRRYARNWETVKTNDKKNMMRKQGRRTQYSQSTPLDK